MTQSDQLASILEDCRYALMDCDRDCDYALIERIDAHRAQADKQGEAEPLFWYRPCRDGLYEGPVHHKSVGGTMLRAEKPGEWFPLYASPHQVAQWQPIETAPKDGTQIIVTGWDYGVIDSKRHITTTTWRNGGGWWEGLSDYENDDSGSSTELHHLTHWMPLHAAPTKEPTNG